MRLLTVGFASLALAACGGAKSSSPAPSSPASGDTAAAHQPIGQAPPGIDQKELEALLAREATGLKPVKGTSSDGAISVSAESSGPVAFEQKKKDVTTVSIPIGASEPLSCILRADSPATGSLVHGVIASVQKMAQRSEIGQLEVALAGKNPYYLVELRYIVEQEGKPVFGTLKIAAFDRPTDTLLCMHDEPGYRATFRRVAEKVSGSLAQKTSDTPTPPIEYEVDIAKVGAQSIGYSIDRHFVNADGGHVETSMMSMLAPRSSTDLANIESSKVVESGKDGLVTKLRTISAEGDEADEDLTVERKGAAPSYHVEGTLKGKPIKGDFTGKDPLLSNWREHDEVKKKLLGGPKLKELVLSAYHPSADPAGITTTTWKATNDATMFDIVDASGGEMRVHVDSTGRVTKGTIKMGAIEIAIERVVFDTKKK